MAFHRQHLPWYNTSVDVSLLQLLYLSYLSITLFCFIIWLITSGMDEVGSPPTLSIVADRRTRPSLFLWRVITAQLLQSSVQSQTEHCLYYKDTTGLAQRRPLCLSGTETRRSVLLHCYSLKFCNVTLRISPWVMKDEDSLFNDFAMLPISLKKDMGKVCT